MERRLWGALCLALACVAPVPASAADDDDGDLLDDEEEGGGGTDAGGSTGSSGGSTSKPKTDGGKIPVEDDEAELDKLKGQTGEDGDLLDGEDTPTSMGAEGVDNDEIFRDYQAKLKGEAPDEELQLWERYLEKYPRTRFRERIDKRMAELEAMLYEGSAGPGKVDALDEEIYLAQPLQLDNINPRSRLQAGFEWGLPDYINLFGDYERALLRNFSVHGGIRHRYTGWRVEGGARYAFLKSARTHTILTGLADVHFNTNPAYPVLRPQIGFGQEFGDLDLQLQVGGEIDTRGKAGVRLIGGLNLTYQAADAVAIFLEAGTYMQSLSSEKGALSYRFNTANFGMKFFPKVDEKRPQAMEVNLGTSVPYTTSYWAYHYGSLMGQVNYFPE